jgi:leader peptidase (prepilin peptidase) / N-methyltransferase
MGWRMLRDYGLGRRDIFFCAVAALPVAAYAWTLVPPPAALAAGYMVLTVLLIALIDHRKFIIPDVLSLPAIPLGLMAAVSAFPEDWRAVLQNHLAAAALAAGVLYLVRLAYRNMRGIEGLGLGDVKLAAASGAWLGLEPLPATLLLASGAALAAVLLRAIRPREEKMTPQTPVPFGSFLAPSIMIVWFARHIMG